MQGIRRRAFVMATAGAITSTMMKPSRASSASDKVVVGVIGLGGQGQSHLKSFLSMPNVEVAYVCDVDSKTISNRR